ncbi:OmpA family protein [Vibrio sp. ABG19]|uniref:OmpA family protein n=1 Tax=Vibrio sp. ABG19 TaxID=2817385 RepID=UPI00249E63C6|nr:OmpA family protein [Vibrio sp. ABG19]WGY47385.1 OmpA family protein [Vibrio sp. ABG19]
MKKLTAMVSASMLVASTATMADLYVGAKVGKTWLDDACHNTESCDLDGTTAGALLGYNLTDWLALEGGYDYLGKFNGAGIYRDTAEAFTIAPKLSVGLTDALDLYGKVGGARVFYGNSSDYSYLGAAGLEYAATSNLGVRLEYQYLSDINNDVVRAKAHTTTLGLVYRFGGSAEPAPVMAPVKPAPAAKPAPEPQIVTKTFEFQRLDSKTFANDSAELSADKKAQLNDLVIFMKEHPQAKVEVTGHTDSSGPEAYNQKLSEKRAQAVAAVLEEKGIAAYRIKATGQGESSPVASNKTAEGREQNRRVEIVIPAFKYQVQQ